MAKARSAASPSVRGGSRRLRPPAAPGPVREGGPARLRVLAGLADILLSGDPVRRLPVRLVRAICRDAGLPAAALILRENEGEAVSACSAAGPEAERWRNAMESAARRCRADGTVPAPGRGLCVFPIRSGRAVFGALILPQSGSGAFPTALFARWLRERIRWSRRASRDALTGLVNRSAWEEAAGRVAAFCRRHRRPLGAIFLDLDGFKSLNDRAGHAAGDRELAEFARGLRRGLRRSDLVGRFGGDEFLALLPGTDLPGTLRAARRLFSGSSPSRRPRIPFSAGVAAAAAGGSGWRTLVRQADAALRRAKRAGGGRLGWRDPETCRTLTERAFRVQGAAAVKSTRNPASSPR